MLETRPLSPNSYCHYLSHLSPTLLMFASMVKCMMIIILSISLLPTYGSQAMRQCSNKLTIHMRTSRRTSSYFYVASIGNKNVFQFWSELGGLWESDKVIWFIYNCQLSMAHGPHDGVCVWGQNLQAF